MAYCGLMMSLGFLVGERLLRPPSGDFLPPLAERLAVGLRLAVAPQLQHVLEHVGAVADDRHVDLDVLVDRRRVDIDMDLGRARREGVDPAGDAVVEAGADADHQIAVVHRPVGFPGAVHAEHAEPLRIGGRDGAEPHQGRGDREAGRLDQLAQQRAGLRTGVDDAAAGVEQRALGAPHQLDRLGDPLGIALEPGLVALMLERGRLRIGALGELDVLRDVDHHRTRPAARGDVERLVQHARQVLDALHQVVVLGAGPGDADGVALLEGIVADQVGRHLAGDDDDRDRIAQRVGQAGDRIGGAGTGGDQHAAHLAGRARIALGGMDRALLVADQDVLDHLLLEDGVIDRQHRAARIAEHVLHALIGEGRDHHFGAGHFLASSLNSAPKPVPKLKKGLKSPRLRTVRPRMADQPPPTVRLPTTTEALGNKIAHINRLSAFRCAFYTARPAWRSSQKP